MGVGSGIYGITIVLWTGLLLYMYNERVIIRELSYLAVSSVPRMKPNDTHLLDATSVEGFEARGGLGNEAI